MKASIAILKHQPHILSGIVFTCLLGLIFSYIYFLSLTVVHVVMRKEADRNISAVRSEISSLEGRYMAAQHRISTEIAQRGDLVVADDKIFINRSDKSIVLSSADGS